jgi:hypothetical protein
MSKLKVKKVSGKYKSAGPHSKGQHGGFDGVNDTVDVTKQLETGGLRGGLKGDVADTYFATVRVPGARRGTFVFKKVRSRASAKGRTGQATPLQQSGNTLKA